MRSLKTQAPKRTIEKLKNEHRKESLQPKLELPTEKSEREEMATEDIPVPQLDGDPDLQQEPRVTEKQKFLLDDVPMQMKRIRENPPENFPRTSKRGRFQDNPLTAEKMPLLAMVATLPGEDTWFSKGERNKLSNVFEMSITGVRVHGTPRRHTYTSKNQGKGRLSVMVNKTGEILLQEDHHGERRRTAEEWKGITVFYETDPNQVCYLDTPDGLVQCVLSPEQVSDVTSVYTCWKEVYHLQLKANGKELDPRFFDNKEKKAFDEADASEWKSWIENEVVNVLSPTEEAKIPRNQIFTAPMRFVRSNKAPNPRDLKAKSRLIVPGHLDPQLGSFRTDSPTTSPLAICLCVTVAVAKKWIGTTFDVSTAFLSGNATQRKVYIRAPKEGLPTVGDKPKVPPGRLLEILKGAYGLSEAPRLWYLRAREVLKELGWEELQCSRATFILKDKSEIVGTMNLHVDDGIVLGDENNRRFKKAITDIDQKFHIKEWKSLKEGITYLGAKWTQKEDGTIVQDMDKYIEENITDIDPSQEPTKKEFRSVLQKLAWPVRQVVPQLAYGASFLAGKVEGPTKEDAEKLHLLVQELKHLSAQGCTKVIYQPVNLKECVMVTCFDASFAKEPGHKSQSGFITFVSDKRIRENKTPCCMVEFQSVKINRVVKSTMAAESASLSKALDRQLYARLLLECILYGEPNYDSNWRHHLKVPGIMVTDAKSLYDHLRTTGSVPSERQTLIDLLIARDLSEHGTVEIRWVPTAHQLADMLTKMMKPPPTAELFLQSQLYSLVQSKEESKKEDHLKELRQGQRKRRKERLQVLKGNPKSLNEE